MTEELLKNILLNQVVIMGGILAPGSELVRARLSEQIKHTREVLDAADDARSPLHHRG